jgi:serine/threonine protein kinase
MEYCSGGTLDKYKDLLEPLTEPQIHHYMVGLRNGLRYLREKNIFHRDLKPQNLLLTEDNILKISDFGLSTSLENDRLTSTICGSPIYMAPEVIGSNLYGVKADLWSVGIIMYQLVYRKHPYVFSDVMQLIKEINTKKIKFPEADVSIRCIHLMTSLLQVQTENRISWGEFFVHPWLEHPVIYRTPYYIVADKTSNLHANKPGPIPTNKLAHVKEKDKNLDKDNDRDKEDKIKSFEFSSDTDHSTCSTITDPEKSNVLRPGSTVSIDRIRPSLTLEDFICDNYENSTEVCRSAPVRATDYTDSIKKIRSTNYFGSSKSIGKITRRTSCIIQDSFVQPSSNNTPLNVRILPSKNK